MTKVTELTQGKKIYVTIKKPQTMETVCVDFVSIINFGGLPVLVGEIVKLSEIEQMIIPLTEIIYITHSDKLLNVTQLL